MLTIFKKAFNNCLMVGLMLCHTWTAAHDLSGNQATLQKTSAKVLVLNFQLDPAALLYKALDSSMSLQTFLTQYSEMPVQQFEQALNRAQGLIVKDLTIIGADDKPLKAVGWIWPSTKQWQDTLRIHLRLYKASPNDLGHSPPIFVRVELQSLRPLAHVQVSMPRAMQPIWVQASPIDRFWLNEKIPMAVVSF